MTNHHIPNYTRAELTEALVTHRSVRAAARALCQANNITHPALYAYIARRLDMHADMPHDTLDDYIPTHTLPPLTTEQDHQ